MNGNSKCDYCINYIFDDESNCHECQINLDEDEMAKFMGKSFESCPYFQFGDEYKTVRKQI